MRVLDPGHLYDLDILDIKPNQPEPACILRFVKREGEGYPGNKGHHAGTNIQEVLRAVVDRLKYVENQVRSEYSQMALRHVKEAIYCLELRAAGRHNRPVTFGIDGAVYGGTCKKCGHVGCGGECHP